MLYKILKTIIYCLDLFCGLLFIFYIVGNYQNFEDVSQSVILDSLTYAAIFTALLTLPVIIDSFFMIFTKQNIRKGVISLIGMLLTVFFCILLIGVSTLLSFLSAGL